MLSLPKKAENLNSGQALVLIILVFAVAMVSVLSVVSRNVTEVQVTSREEDSLRAFNAAEAGVEHALINPYASNAAIPPTLAPGITNSVIVDHVGTSATSFIHPTEVGSGEAVTFWLVSHDSNTGALTCSGTIPCFQGSSVEVCWGDMGSPQSAAEVSIYWDSDTGSVNSGNFDTVKVFRKTFDSNSTRRLTNGFSATTTCGSMPGQSLQYSTGSINLSTEIPCTGVRGCMLMARVKLFYNSDPSPVGVRNAANLPNQGIKIESTGFSGQASRKINVYQSYPEPPFIFDSALFSETDIVQ